MRLHLCLACLCCLLFCVSPLAPPSRPLLQAFFEFFQGLPGQQRLVGYSVYGDTYYAGPGRCVEKQSKGNGSI